MPFGIIPDLVFGFAGIPSWVHWMAMYKALQVLLACALVLLSACESDKARSRRITIEFGHFNLPREISNDELDVENDRLENELSVREGRAA